VKNSGYSLVEVMVASVVVAVALTAAAIMAGVLSSRQESNVFSLRAANLQEQAVTLYRLGLQPTQIVALVPEACGTTSTPAQGALSLVFSAESGTNVVIEGENTSLDFTTCTVILPEPVAEGAPSYISNQVGILRPSVR
jgi:prepilin-type N-terminal cleavage/methylation domain-containing protein